MEKEHTLAQTSEKLELVDSLRDALKEKEEQQKDVADKLLQTENNVSKAAVVSTLHYTSKSFLEMLSWFSSSS